MDNKTHSAPKETKNTFGDVYRIIDLQFRFTYDSYTAKHFWKDILQSNDIDKVAEALAHGIGSFAVNVATARRILGEK